LLPRPIASSDALIAELRGFDAFGAKTVESEQDGIPYFINEFWTSGQRRAHSLHEISYRACFKPQLPQFFISRLTAPGEGVYDPFMGRGTTPLQAALMGRRPIGNDMNPLSALLTRPRLAPPALSAKPWRARGRLDQNGRAQPAHRPFAGVFLGLYAAAQPSGFRGGASQDQR
jgi:hypothetical protein